MIDCDHDLSEQETSCADGLCPICLQKDLAVATEHVRHLLEPGIDLHFCSKCQAAKKWLKGRG